MIPMTLEQVIRAYADMVYRLALAQTRSPSDADDIFQDVFLRYAEKAPEFQSEEHRKAWLLRVTVNRCRTHFRSGWLRRLVPLEAATAAVPAPEVSPLDEALSRLPAKYRTVVHLYYYENYSTEQIAEVTGQAASTVRSQLTRARDLLHDLLKGGNEDVSGRVSPDERCHPCG